MRSNDNFDQKDKQHPADKALPQEKLHPKDRPYPPEKLQKDLQRPEAAQPTAEAASPRPFNYSGFSAYLAEGQLMGTRCTACGAVYLPPRELCPACYAAAMDWLPFSGEGQLVGFTAIALGLPEFTAEGYDRSHPYCSGVVRLREGPAISAQIVQVDCAHPESIRIGLPLRATFIEYMSGKHKRTRLAFEPVG